MYVYMFRHAERGSEKRKKYSENRLVQKLLNIFKEGGEMQAN